MSVFWSRIILLSIICVIGFLALFQTPQTSPEYLSVRFLDVGQGDAIHIQTPDGYEMLIDGGPNSLVLRELAQGRSFFDTSIDVVIATHPDTDHIGGLVDVLQRYTVDTVIQTNNINETPAAAAYDQEVLGEGENLVQAQTGQIVRLGASTTVRVLAPSGDTSQWRSNAASIIVQVSYGDIDFLLTGDASVSTEDYVAQFQGTAIESEVLKLGHHGSQTSTSGFFLDAVQPEYAVVSAEANSRYGHPHADVIARVEERGIEVVSTAQEGTIEFLTDGVTVWKK
jgi:competence protein ComEC